MTIQSVSANSEQGGGGICSTSPGRCNVTFTQEIIFLIYFALFKYKDDSHNATVKCYCVAAFRNLTSLEKLKKKKNDKQVRTIREKQKGRIALKEESLTY